LVFPLQAADAAGGMLMIRRPERGSIWPARFISRAWFIPCAAPPDDEAGRRLAQVFAKGDAGHVQSFRTDGPIDETCWHAGEGWWLSTAAPTK
jgi:protein-L-isoaspartate(D-aspartate) O-methyltransferase